MSLDHTQLRSLLAVVREGSFEGAAQALHVTPSAISQRIKQLEGAVGGIVVVRGACTPTSLGQALYRHGLQVELLEHDLERALTSSDARASAPIGLAVNADSLATWVVPALSQFTADTGQALDVVVDDQDHTAEWLRSGRVLGAVTVEARPVQGCRVQPLGVMRYRAVACRTFLRSWAPHRVDAPVLSRAPVIAFNRKDQLHEQWARRSVRRRVRFGVVHLIPNPQAILHATASGIGWAMNPELLIDRDPETRALVELTPGSSLDVPLYWQQWALTSSILDALAAAMKHQAGRSLRPA